MTCTLVTPWWRQRSTLADPGTASGGVDPTPILDWEHPLVRALAELGATGTSGFTNTGGETLFDAVVRTAVDWDGLTCGLGGASACDLSATVLVDLGHFNSRDELFARHGQTLCGPLTTLADPVLGRWAPPLGRIP